MATPAKQETWAVVDNKYVLPLSDAVLLIELLAKAQHVENTWDHKNPWKAATAAPELSIKLLNVAQYAAIQLSVE